MKVKVPGRPQWPRELKCPCDAVLEVEHKDVRYFCRKGYDFTGEANGEVERGVKCPECDRWVVVKERA